MAKVTLQEVGAGYSASTDLNANNATIEAAFENTLSRDGTVPNTMLVDLDMNSNRVTNLTDGVNPQDAVTVSQVTDLVLAGGATVVAAGTGITVTPAIDTYTVALDAATQASLATIPTGLVDAPIVTYSASADLTAERVLTAGAGITLSTAVAGQISIAATAVTDHGALTGLADDDHTQYAQIAAAETISGTWTYKSYELGWLQVPQNSQSANYTLVIGDSGKHVLHPSAGGAGDTFTIPANASVAFPVGTAISFVNRSSDTVAIAITTDTMYLGGTATSGTRTLAQNGVATALKVESTVWIITGVGLT